MLKKYLLLFVLCIAGTLSSQNPVEKFYEAYNQKKWKKFKSLLHKDFKCIVRTGNPATREEFFNNIYANDIWFAEWKILNMTEKDEGCYLIQGTFTNEYDMFLYGAPVEGLWTYCTKNKKIISIEWHEFPENPNQSRGDAIEKDFNDWIILNYPQYTGISIYWSHNAAIIFRDLFRQFKKGRE